jgi:hypothetical protein
MAARKLKRLEDRLSKYFYLPCILVVLSVTGCLAQSGPTIKGHTLGESIADFISKTNSGPRLQKCRDKEAKHPKKNSQWCKSFIAAVDTGGRFATTLDVESISDTATFDRGKLVAIHIRTASYGYADMLRDMKTRLGEPSKTEDTVSQNGYGATFHHPRAIWLSNSVCAVLAETGNFGNVIGYYNAIDLDIATADELKLEIAEQKANRVDTLK